MNLIVRSAMKEIKWAKQIEDSGCGAILHKTEGSKGLSDGEAVGWGSIAGRGHLRHKFHTGSSSRHLRGSRKAGQVAEGAR